eukprot:10294867-Lingulodinium_polyedra.AAC.1
MLKQDGSNTAGATVVMVAITALPCTGVGGVNGGGDCFALHSCCPKGDSSQRMVWPRHRRVLHRWHLNGKWHCSHGQKRQNAQIGCDV